MQSNKLQLECDLFLTRAQAGEAVPEESSTEDFFLIERKSLAIEFVVSVTPTQRPYKFWYKKCGHWKKASCEVCHVVTCTNTSID